MSNKTASDIRQAFLDYFRRQNHEVVASGVSHEVRLRRAGHPDRPLRLVLVHVERDRMALEQAGDGGSNRASELRRREITSHLHHLRKWDDGAPIIEVELSDG